MTYLYQLVSLMLALFGAFYKNTTVAGADNKTLYRYGLPMLTRTGKVLVILLALSFSLSLYSSWRSAKEAKAKNDDLQGKLNRMQQTSIEILTGQVEEQDRSIKRYKDLLETQRTTGQETIDTISSSAETLRTRVDSSISLLNQTGIELNRAANPINELSISFEAYVPWDNQAIDSYHDRLTTSVQQMQTSGLDFNEVYISNVGGKTTRLGIYNHSSLLPEASSEPVAYGVFRAGGVRIEFYKNHLPMQRLVSGGQPDLTFTAYGQLSDNTRTGLHAFYDFENKRHPVSLSASDLVPDTQYSHRKENIRSIPDLLRTQMLVRFEGVIFHLIKC